MAKQQSEYTRGKWKWEWESGKPIVRAHDPKDPLKLVATVYPKQRKEISFDFLINEAEANANLIAASPDTYEGLKDALREICRMCVRLNPQHENCTSCEEMERSRLPLLKAEGKDANNQ